MKLEDLVSIDQLVDFLSGTQAVVFSVLSDKDACYQWIQATLVRFSYLTLPRQDKSIVTLPIASDSLRCLVDEDQRLFPTTGHPTDWPIP